MHGLVTHVALSAAQAVAKSGRPIRMAQHVMLRVDIALTMQDRMVSSPSTTQCTSTNQSTVALWGEQTFKTCPEGSTPTYSGPGVCN